MRTTGFGGSNSAVIIEQAPPKTAKAHANGHPVNGSNGVHGTNGVNGNGTSRANVQGSLVQSRQLFVFSAKTQVSQYPKL